MTTDPGAAQYLPLVVYGTDGFRPAGPGTLEMLILQSVRQGEPMHGYAIVTSIQQRSADVLKVDEGALYPALHRLELRGLLRSKWGFSDNNRRAKYYSLTEAGRQELDREASAWRRISAAIARVMKPS